MNYEVCKNLAVRYLLSVTEQVRATTATHDVCPQRTDCSATSRRREVVLTQQVRAGTTTDRILSASPFSLFCQTEKSQAGDPNQRTDSPEMNSSEAVHHNFKY